MSHLVQPHNITYCWPISITVTTVRLCDATWCRRLTVSVSHVNVYTFQVRWSNCMCVEHVEAAMQKLGGKGNGCHEGVYGEMEADAVRFWLRLVWRVGQLEGRFGCNVL